jgi:hypothetical protein
MRAPALIFVVLAWELLLGAEAEITAADDAS